MKDIEQNNVFYFKNLREKIKARQKIKKIDIFSDKTKDQRFQNLTNQIYALQMKQIAESICNIKKDVKKNKYILIFDSTEIVDPLTLEETDYKELLKFRDPMNSISVYDLFQEKIHSYYNTNVSSVGVAPKGRTASKSKQKNNNSKLSKSVSRIKKVNFNKSLNIKKSKPKEEVQIAKIVSINYDFCHHCKQRKPSEIMVKCKSNNCNKIFEKPMKSYCVNNITVVRSKYKLFMIILKQN